MISPRFRDRFLYCLAVASLVLVPSTSISAQSTASIEGQIIDAHGDAVAGAEVQAISRSISLLRVVQTDSHGRYQFAGLPVGDYSLEVRAHGFKLQVFEMLVVEVGRRITQDFQLGVGDVSEQVTVSSSNSMIERATISVGHVIDRRMVREIPSNGRYFLDLGLLIPGAVTPPQGAFSASPMRGSGSFAINIAGNREETVNYMVNGITLNNLAFSSISFQPTLSTVQEFKVDNSTFSAEYGQSSGAIVNIATRSGANNFHGEVFEYIRNDAFDARNFFEFTTAEPASFKRNQFGGSFGGPLVKEKTFFFFSYEGLRQRQNLDLNSVVLSDSQRAAVTNPAIAKLIELIPRANFVDSSGTSRFISSAPAPVDVDQWTIDINHNLTNKDRLHGYYAIYRRKLTEPNRFGSTIPGFGHTTDTLRQIFTLNENHTFRPNLANEARFGFNRFYSTSTPNAQLNPGEFGINNGVTTATGLPQINVAGGSLNFGGPATQPSGRGDTTFVVSDTLSWLVGRHSLKLGGEFRQFYDNNFRRATGSFNFPTVSSFVSGIANSFSITLGDESSSVSQRALGFFGQDNWRLSTNLTLELGLRYEWNITPTERYDRFIVFDPQNVSLIRVGSGVDEVYEQNNKNFQPRLGFAWDPFGKGRSVVRAAYAVLVDQPMTSVVTPLSGNPPLAVPLTFTGPIDPGEALAAARPAGLAPQTIDHGFNNAYMQSWNLNLQHEFTSRFAVMLGYFGSKGTNLITRRNLNQPVNGVRPYPALSDSSPILPGVALGNITQVEGTGNSTYNALWVSATQRLARGLQFNASYTWSRSLDYTSFSSSGVVVQDSYDLDNDRGLSDFDARHRTVVSAIYDLPFTGNGLVEGWQIAAIVQSQSGNPFNIVTSNSSVNGVANTLRPDVTGPVEIPGEVERWFETSSFTPVGSFGNLGRNVVIGPRFDNTDVALIKNTHFTEDLRMQFRAEVFDVFNHANFGRPGNVVNTPAFGRITSTRFPTGESGSSRQLQFALKFLF
jgi:TonB dependent receptor/Carboxypeptidase regulatory-like domain